MGNIYLVGFMGTGKSAVGRELAKIKKWQFVDLDDLIEFRERRRITDIFAQEGEPYFRRAETSALREVAKQKNFVVACGGGIVLDQQNIRLMQESGKVICLAASPDAIFKRISTETHRPLLNVADPEKQIELLLKLRLPFYSRIDWQIDTSRSSVKEVVRKVLGLLAGKKKASGVKISRTARPRKIRTGMRTKKKK